jgi:hypothetical protein
VGALERPVYSVCCSTLALPDDLRSPIRAEREELRNLHFFPPEYGGEFLSGLRHPAGPSVLPILPCSPPFRGQ